PSSSSAPAEKADGRNHNQGRNQGGKPTVTRSRCMAYVGCLLAAALAFLSPVTAQAAYPDRPVTLIVPYAAGGPTDAIAPVVAQRLAERLGRGIVVENRGGAGGNIGMQVAAKASADGYTLFFGASGPVAINPSLYSSLKLDPTTAFDPVASIALSWNV